MRMAPRWLVVGEMHRGGEIMALFRAQMSDHPGLSTFHAQTPDHAVTRLSVILGMDERVRAEDAKSAFAMAVDLVLQVGWREGKRQILGVWEVDPELHGGSVRFRQLYQPGEEQLAEFTRR